MKKVKLEPGKQEEEEQFPDDDALFSGPDVWPDARQEERRQPRSPPFKNLQVSLIVTEYLRAFNQDETSAGCFFTQFTSSSVSDVPHWEYHFSMSEPRIEDGPRNPH